MIQHSAAVRLFDTVGGLKKTAKINEVDAEIFRFSGP